MAVAWMGRRRDRPADTPLSGADAPGERADVYVIRAPDVSADRASATDDPRVGTEVGQGREVLPDGLGGVSDITGPNVDVPGVDEAESGDGPGSEYAGEVAGPADAQCDACDDATWGAWLDGQEAGDAARDMEDRGGVLDGA